MMFYVCIIQEAVLFYEHPFHNPPNTHKYGCFHTLTFSHTHTLTHTHIKSIKFKSLNHTLAAMGQLTLGCDVGEFWGAAVLVSPAFYFSEVIGLPRKRNKWNGPICTQGFHRNKTHNQLPGHAINFRVKQIMQMPATVGKLNNCFMFMSVNGLLSPVRMLTKLN